MNFESKNHVAAEKSVEVPQFNHGVADAGSIKLPDGRTIELTSITFKGPVENSTYEGKNADGGLVRVATTTHEGATKVVGVWVDDEEIYAAPTIH